MAVQGILTQPQQSFDARRRGPGGAASFGGERRLVECPHGKPISPPRAGKCSDETAAPHGRVARLGRDLETVAYLARNRKFESISLLRRVNKLSVPLKMTLVDGASDGAAHIGGHYA